MYAPARRYLYPGNADVPVGTLPAPAAIVRIPADEDVSDPRAGCKLFFQEKPRIEG